MTTLKITRPGWDDTILEYGDDSKLIVIEQGEQRIVLDRAMLMTFFYEVLPAFRLMENLYSEVMGELLGVTRTEV